MAARRPASKGLARCLPSPLKGALRSGGQARREGDGRVGQLDSGLPRRRFSHRMAVHFASRRHGQVRRVSRVSLHGQRNSPDVRTLRWSRVTWRMRQRLLPRDLPAPLSPMINHGHSCSSAQTLRASRLQ